MTTSPALDRELERILARVVEDEADRAQVRRRVAAWRRRRAVRSGFVFVACAFVGLLAALAVRRER